MTNTPPRQQIVFTRNKAVAFKAAHAEAVSANQDQFTFEGHEFATAYAKYMIEYLDDNFRRPQ